MKVYFEWIGSQDDAVYVFSCEDDRAVGYFQFEDDAIDLSTPEKIELFEQIAKQLKETPESITPLADAAVARVLDYGAKKHRKHRFEDGIEEFNERERFAKIDRHLQAGRVPGNKDYETCEDALVHMIIQAKMIVEMRERKNEHKDS